MQNRQARGMDDFTESILTHTLYLMMIERFSWYTETSSDERELFAVG
jgi:hypothetical protein